MTNDENITVVDNETTEEAETATAATEHDTDDGQGEQTGRKGVRQKLAEQAQRIEELAGILDRTRQAQYEAVLAGAGVDADFAAAKGITVDAYLDDGGLLDVERLTADAERVRAAAGIPARPKGNPLAGRLNSDTRAVSWADVTRRAMPGSA